MCYCNDAETEYKDERQGNQIMTGGGNGLNKERAATNTRRSQNATRRAGSCMGMNNRAGSSSQEEVMGQKLNLELIRLQNEVLRSHWCEGRLLVYCLVHLV